MAAESGKYQYSYDELSQLIRVSKDDRVIKTFGYDAFGNRDYMVDKGVKTEYIYNTLNQLSRIENTKSAQDFQYDKRGNLRQMMDNGNITNTYEFGAINRLTRAVSANGEAADYEYNGIGLRVGKRIMDGNYNRLVQSDQQARWNKTREETMNYFERFICAIGGLD
jgi:YD repeat-containing protein